MRKTALSPVVTALVCAFLAGCNARNRQSVRADCPCPLVMTVKNVGNGSGTVYLNGFLLTCPAAPVSEDGRGYVVCGQATLPNDTNQVRFDILANQGSQIGDWPCPHGGSTSIVTSVTCMVPSVPTNPLPSSTFAIDIDRRGK